MLPKPPMTAAMNALRTGVKPMYGLIWPAWTANRRPATAANAPPIANAVATTRFTLIPISWAATRSSAAARIDSPSRVRDHDRDGDGEWQARAQREGREVGGDHHQVAVGEVDQPEDPEDHREADGHERVETARAERVDDLLEEVVAHPYAPRYDRSTW